MGKLTPEEARTQARKLLGQMATGIDIVLEEKKDRNRNITLLQAFDDYKDIRNLAKKTLYDYERAIETTFYDWKNKQITAIQHGIAILNPMATCPVKQAKRLPTVLSLLLGGLMPKINRLPI